MPVSICEPLSAAIRDTLSTTTSSTSKDENLTNQLNASAKQILLTKIEYEETNIYNSAQSSLQSKYMYIKSKCNNNGSIESNVNFNLKSAIIEKECKQAQGNSDNNGSQQQYLSKESKLPKAKRILYPRDNIQLGWNNSNRIWKVGAGMINVGNTCYLNSALQAIFHVPAFANWLLSDIGHREKCQNQDACIVCGMAETLIETQKNDNNAIKPWRIYSRLRLICRHLIPGRQEDSHEFLRYLIDAMEKSYLQRLKNSKELDQFSKETTPLNQILGGYLRSAVRCLSCGYISTTFQHFEDMILDIKKANTIDEALEFYFARERLEDMGYNCESCKKKVSATKQFFLERPPAVLCVQLKRFIIGSKLNKHVDIRTTLDLSPYLSPQIKKQQPQQSLKYKLVSMITHLGGSQHNGHYTAIGWTALNQYFQFDDSYVRKIDVNSVLNTNAYVMFYELETTNTSNNSTSTSLSNETYKSTNSTITSSISNNIKLNSSNNLESSNNNNTKGFIGPMLPPQLQTQFSPNKTSNSTTVKGSENTTNDKQSNYSSNFLTSSPNSKINIHKSIQNGFYKNSSNEINNNNNNNNSNNKNENILGNRNNGLKRSHSNVSIEKSEENGLHTKNSISSPTFKQEKRMMISPSMPLLIDDISTKPSTSTASIFNSNLLKNNSTPPKLKPLVPYDSDDDDDDYDNFENDTKKKVLNISAVKVNDELESSSSTSSPSSPSNKSYESIEITKTGPWKVTNLYKSSEQYSKSKPNDCKLDNGVTNKKHFNDNTKNGGGYNNGNDHKHDNENKIFNHNDKSSNYKNNYVPSINNNNNNNTEHKNGLNRSNFNSNKNYNNRGRNPINQLIRSGGIHGYGHHVRSWNDEKSNINNDISEERKEERKRQKDDERENDMDRGKTKKNKNNNRLTGRDNPGYNPFEETQFQQNRRWANNNGRFYSHIYRQNPHFRNHKSHRHNNHRNNFKSRENFHR